MGRSGRTDMMTPPILPPMTAPVSVEDEVSGDVGAPAMIKILNAISTLDLCGGKKTKQTKKTSDCTKLLDTEI